MSTTQAPTIVTDKRFKSAREWLSDLGDVPLDRVVFDPWPGTATEDDVLALERQGRLCELIDGTLVEKGMGYWESVIATNLIVILGGFVRAHNLGVVSGESGMMKLLPGRVRIPDVAFISSARLSSNQIGKLPIPAVYPDLAVEVLSQSNTSREMAKKVEEYFRCGTQLVWIIDPKTRTVTVHVQPGTLQGTLQIDGALEGAACIPGFQMPVAELFRGLPDIY